MVRRNMTNNEIYTTAIALSQNVANANLCLPIKVNFYLQKNITALMEIAQDLEKSRTEILQKYGKQNDSGNYDFEGDNLEKANEELTELFKLEQEVPIYEINLNDFGNVELDGKQVQAISYMIKEEE